MWQKDHGRIRRTRFAIERVNIADTDASMVKVFIH